MLLLALVLVLIHHFLFLPEYSKFNPEPNVTQPVSPDFGVSYFGQAKDFLIFEGVMGATEGSVALKDKTGGIVLGITMKSTESVIVCTSYLNVN